MSNLVQQFNALPRRMNVPSGRFPNEWHFDVRYVQIEPNPSHIIFFFQPHSQFTHTERVPLGLADDESGLKFFPETAKEAAPTVVKGILYGFVNNLGQNDKELYPQTPQPIAPYKLTTGDKALAAAVGHELRRIGVDSEALCNIGISNQDIVQVAMKSFIHCFVTQKILCGIDDIVGTPGNIVWEDCRVPKPVPSRDQDFEDEEDQILQTIADYYSLWASGLPSDGTEYEARRYNENLGREMARIQTLYKQKPERVINAAADRGDADAALDYGIRLTVGLGCKRNRKRAREYLMKVTYANNASKTVKAMAHGILIQWYLESDTGIVTPRYAFAACHHCNAAAKLCAEVSPPGVRASPAVLWFMLKMFETLTEDVLEFRYWYTDAIKALDARSKEYRENREKMEKRMKKDTLRYLCAAPHCEIRTDTGSMFSRCSGKCDKDKKPYYCSKECQRADWKNHRPFCRPGARTSVIDDGSKYDLSATAPSHKSEMGTLMIPITFRDGETRIFCSSTMDAKMLKEMKQMSEKDLRP